jgi:ribosomal protein S18 acetylase RimI-like enzyme
MKKPTVEISIVSQVDANLVASFAQLFPQLTKNNPPPDEDLLQRIVQSETSHILIARDTEAYGRIVGTLTLAFYVSPTGIKAWIEDVVVDGSYRGRGIGKALTQKAIDLAERENAKVVLLTSNPARESANGLYKKLGFTLRATNFYQLKL